jgi:predicted dienelactone hydrolase
MRYSILALVLCLAMSALARAEAPAFHAGMTRISVQDDVPFEAIVWYPTMAEETITPIGPWPVAAAMEAPIAGEGRLPVVLLSHGSGGSPWVHRDLASHLARDGFIVVAPVHVGDSSGRTEARQEGRSLIIRPRQAVKAVEATLADPRFHARADAPSMAMVGFSAGGYTALVLAGARPNFALAEAYCRSNPDDIGSCGRGQNAASGHHLITADWSRPDELGLKAIVLMDPLAITFDAAALASVRIPVLLFHPEDSSYLRAGANSSAVAAGLPQPVRQVAVPGNHFVFIDPCPSDIATKAPEICRDGPGVDRAAIHGLIEAEVSRFLRSNLRGGQTP